MPPFGKSVARNVYFHVNLLDTLEPEARDAVHAASRIAQVYPGEDYNVVKLNRDKNGVSLLDYPGLFEEGFPVLRRYWTVDLENHTVRFRTYENSLNPPILHRKELLLPANHPQREMFEALTSAAEQIGLFDDPCRIGFKQAWDILLAQRGFKVAGHELVPIGNDEFSLPSPSGRRAGDEGASNLNEYSSADSNARPVRISGRFENRVRLRLRTGG
jgi:DNA phosphorothioation-associated putative methyltransferase